MIALLYVGSSLIVLGFTFMIIKGTWKLASPEGKIASNVLIQIGIIPCIAGIILAVISFMLFDENIRKAMLTSSFNLFGLGLTTIIRRFITLKNEDWLKCAANSVVIVGFLLWIAYAVVIYFFPS